MTPHVGFCLHAHRIWVTEWLLRLQMSPLRQEGRGETKQGAPLWRNPKPSRKPQKISAPISHCMRRVTRLGPLRPCHSTRGSSGVLLIGGGFKRSPGGGNNGLPSPSETSQNPHPQDNHEENTRKIQNGGSFYKMPDTLLKTVKVIQKKENLRNCHNHWEPKDAWKLNVLWCPGWDPGTEKGH